MNNEDAILGTLDEMITAAPGEIKQALRELRYHLGEMLTAYFESRRRIEELRWQQAQQLVAAANHITALARIVGRITDDAKLLRIAVAAAKFAATVEVENKTQHLQPQTTTGPA
jgi:hypothetical protein